MANQPYELAKFASKVFESERGVPVWMLGEPYEGVEVSDRDSQRLDEVNVSFFFVLPRLTWKSGIVNLLTVARGLPADVTEIPSFWDPLELKSVRGGVYAHVSYDPGREQFRVAMNTGGVTRELLGVTLDGAPPDLVCGRVLHCHVEVNEDRIFASVNDFFAEGELALDGLAPSTGAVEHPWGLTAAGHWWVFSGVDDSSARAASLPPGLGLSDLRITLGSDACDSVASLPYSGSLDHLAEATPLSAAAKEILALLRHAAKLRKVADDFEEQANLLPGAGRPEAEGAAA